MFSLLANDMATAVRFRSCEAEHREIARFRSAAGETDFVWLNFQERGDLVARIIERVARVASGAMNTGSVSEIFREVRLHRFARGIAQRRGRVVIEINHSLKRLSSALAVCFARFGTTATSFSS